MFLKCLSADVIYGSILLKIFFIMCKNVFAMWLLKVTKDIPNNAVLQLSIVFRPFFAVVQGFHFFQTFRRSSLTASFVVPASRWY